MNKLVQIYQKYLYVFFLLMTLFLSLVYQNCSQKEFQVKDILKTEEGFPNFHFSSNYGANANTINGGACTKWGNPPCWEQEGATICGEAPCIEYADPTYNNDDSNSSSSSEIVGGLCAAWAEPHCWQQGDSSVCENTYCIEETNPTYNDNAISINKFGFTLNSQSIPNNQTPFLLNLDENKEIYLSWDVMNAKKLTLTYKLIKKEAASERCVSWSTPSCHKVNDTVICGQSYCTETSFNGENDQNNYCGLELNKENLWNIFYEEADFKNKEIYLNFTGSECLRYGSYEIRLKAEDKDGTTLISSAILNIL